MNPLMPSEDKILEVINMEFSNWLFQESLKLFEEKELENITNVPKFFKDRGYDIEREHTGGTISFKLVQGSRIISHHHLNLTTVTFRLMEQARRNNRKSNTKRKRRKKKK